MTLARVLTAPIALGLLAGPAFAAEAPAAPAAAAPSPAASPAPSDRWLFLPRGNRWIAGGLSLACNGAGQLYNGESEKGLGMLAGWLAFPVAYGVDALVGSSYVRLFAFAANVGVKAWSVTDAWEHAAPPDPAPSPAASSKPAKP